MNRVIRSAYRLLGLKTFYTAGPKEVRAWTVQARRDGAAGRGRDPHGLRARLHPRRGDRLRPFIERRGENGAREAGELRLEGKTYVVQEGDVIHFRFNV